MSEIDNKEDKLPPISADEIEAAWEVIILITK
jgi:hypothetical protein